MLVRKENMWELELWGIRLRHMSREVMEPPRAAVEPNPKNMLYLMTQELLNNSSPATKNDLTNKREIS